MPVRPATTARPPVGLWWDLKPAATIPDIDLQISHLRQAGISEVQIFCNSSTLVANHIRWKWQPSEVATFIQALTTAGIRAGATFWAWPKVDAVREVDTWLRDVSSRCPLAEVELDLEGQWRRSHVEGYSSLAAAGESLYRSVRAAAPQALIGVTSYPLHGEWTTDRSTVSILSQSACPQAYSRYVPGDESLSWGASYGPGSMQQLSALRALKSAPHRLVIGLAAWSQKFPGHSVAEAVQVARSAAIASGADALRYWSAKWLFGQGADPEVLAALK